MNIATNLETIIKENTQKLGYSYDCISDKTKLYLSNIEQIISNIFEKEKIAYELISNNKININSISEKADIARQTIYNNQILKEYIEYRSKSFEKIKAFRDNESQKEELKKLKIILKNNVKNDIELLEAKHQIKELQKIIEEKNKIIDELSKN